MYRTGPHGLEVLLVHPGGPFWRQKDLASWTIPKGEFEATEDPLEAAKRELREETGAEASGPFVALTPVKQKGGKMVHAWAVESDWDPALLRSNSFRMEYPPGTGRMMEFPEVDRAEWFSMPQARARIMPAQEPLLTELEALLTGG
jgi:predicted NUDIX family NTP pyrophosphohydrolase